MKNHIIAAALLAATGSACAITAQTNVYVSGQFGWTSDNNFPDTSADNITTTNNGYTFGSSIGYEYAVNDHFLTGIELNYTDFGNVSYGLPGFGFKIRNTAIQLLATARYLASNGFNVFGKLGTSYSDTSADTNAIYFPGISQSVTLQDESAVIPAIAIGVGFQPSQQMNITLQYEHLFGAAWHTGSAQPKKPIALDSVTIGLQYMLPA